jgi:hypothetical protein
MSYIGTVTQGVIVLPPDVKLREGSRVRVEPLAADLERGTLGQRLLRFAGTVEGLPADMARNHDRYLHGHANR